MERKSQKKYTLVHSKLNVMGFTIAELMIGLAIVGVLLSIAIPVYQNHEKLVAVDQAIEDLTLLESKINEYQLKNGYFPNCLACIGMADMKDPWGNPYQYVNYESSPLSDRRKEKNISPINSDYDLFSKGENGQTTKQCVTTQAQDDIVRGRDGTFMGLAKDF